MANSAVKMFFIVPRGTCRFYPSCSHYAQEAIKTLPAPIAIYKIALRLLRCNPLFKGGYDPVISKRKVQTS